MTYKGHLIFSVAMIIFIKKLSIFSLLSKSNNWGHILIGTILASLLPDIDHPKSWLGQKFKIFSIPISKTFGHRSMTHSLLAVLIYTNFLLNTKIKYFLPPDISYAMIISYISHIIADIITPAGVPLLWPMPWKFKIPLIYTKKNILCEKYFCTLILFLAILYPINLGYFKDLFFKYFYK